MRSYFRDPPDISESVARRASAVQTLPKSVDHDAPRVPLDLIIVGAGQAGLAASHAAARAGLRYAALDASDRTGDAWRARYDSLRLFTPRSYSALPELALPGEPNGYPTKNEMADYLVEYRNRFDLRVHHGHRVTALVPHADHLRLETEALSLGARAVILATGPFQTPRTPAWSAELEVPSLHSSLYRRPEHAPGRRVLVVGGGNSGAQIAVELAQAGRDVVWAVSESTPRFVRLSLMGRSTFWWLDRLGLLTAPSDSLRARIVRRRGDPIFGSPPETTPAQGGVVLASRAVAAHGRTVSMEDGSTVDVDSVVFCTGFDFDYSWAAVPGLTDLTGRPRHDGGISLADPRIAFVGLPWQSSRQSALVRGAGTDAQRVVARLGSQML